MSGFDASLLVIAGLFVLFLIPMLLKLGYRRRFYKYAVPILRDVRERSGRLSQILPRVFPDWAEAAGADLVVLSFRPRALQLRVLGLIAMDDSNDPGLSITALGREVLQSIDSGKSFGEIWDHIQTSLRKKRRH